MEKNFENSPRFEQIDEPGWNELLSAAGFSESEEMVELRNQYATGEGDHVQTAQSYRDAVEAVVSEMAEKDFRDHMVLNVAMARLQFEAGEKENAVLDLKDTYEYALNMGQEELADSLIKIIHNLESESSLKDKLLEACAEVLSEEALDDLRDSEESVALDNAFTFLIEAGIEPENYLRDKSILE